MRASRVLFLSLLLSIANCFGHDTWMSPSSYAAEPGQKVTFQLTSGMEFPKLDAAIKPERIHQARFRLGSEERELEKFQAGAHALQTEHSFPKPGVATLWMQLKPKEIELTDDDVAHYLDEIRAPAEVQRAWAAQKGREKWKELYTKCAKTILIIGSPSAERSWADPVGLALEVLPLADPTALRVGQETSFKLLRKGKPLAGIALALHVENDAGPRYATSDAEGVVRFPLEKAGPTMLATVYLRPPAGAGKPWESEFSTLTFDVKGE